MPIWISPSESKRTIFRSGRASARPSAKEACPPMAGSPSGRSRFGCWLMWTQCRPPRPGITIALPLWALNTFSSSAVSIMGVSSPGEAVILVRHQHRHRPLRFPRFLERDRDARRVAVTLDQVVVDAEGIEEALGVGRGGIGVDAVARIAAVADHHHHRHIHPERPAAQGIAGFHEAG